MAEGETRKGLSTESGMVIGMLVGLVIGLTVGYMIPGMLLGMLFWRPVYSLAKRFGLTRQ